MRRFTLALLFALVAARPAAAQVTARSHYNWDQDGPDLATVQAFTTREYCDNAPTGTVLTPVTCAGTVTPFQCSALVPAKAAGSHTCDITAADAAGESLPSNVLTFPFITIPLPPKNVRIVP